MGIRSLALLLVLLMPGRLAATAQDVNDSALSGAERFAALRKSHNEVWGLLKGAAAKLDAAKKAYAQTLEHLAKGYQETGDSESLRACLKEQQRLLREGTVEGTVKGEAPAPLQSAQERYSRQEREAKRNLLRLVAVHRQYRLRLLDLHQSAVASDDDNLAEALAEEIEKINALILEDEETLAQASRPEVDPGDRLPLGLERGLVLHYRFDKSVGARVIDASGFSNHGTAHGARWSSHGRRKGAFWFDGIDDYIETPNAESLRISRTLTLSICVLQEPDETAASGLTAHLLSKSDVSGADYALDIAASRTVGAALRHRENEKRRIRIHAEPAKCKVGFRQWTHVVLVYDGRIARVYVDGDWDKTVVAPDGIGISMAPFNIGRCGNGSWEFGFTGRVDDVLVWNRALSEAEVLGLWVAFNRSADDPASL